MKVFTTLLKILAALAAIAGAVYVIATYGDKIVAWAKRVLGCSYDCFYDCDCDCDCDCECDCDCQEEEAQEADFEG